MSTAFLSSLQSNVTGSLLNSNCQTLGYFAVLFQADLLQLEIKFARELAEQKAINSRVKRLNDRQQELIDELQTENENLRLDLEGLRAHTTQHIKQIKQQGERFQDRRRNQMPYCLYMYVFLHKI